jgi:YD repeat-containing protein
VTQIATGYSTTRYTHDYGNLAQKNPDGVTTTYVYDYANRLIALRLTTRDHHLRL